MAGISVAELKQSLNASERFRSLRELLTRHPNVYLVGGAVRDALLGRPLADFDFVVEGDATVVGRALAVQRAGRLTVHDRFRTATVEIGDIKVDLASSRRESYPEAGALPVVHLGATIDEDLERRDFTVNAIAYALVDERIVTVPGAEDDLAARRLAVLHPESFRDDPTRLFRLLRYRARLGFTASAETEKLFAGAIADDYLDTVSGPRKMRELSLLLAEPQPAAIGELMSSGVGQRLLGTAGRPDPDLLKTIVKLTPEDCDLAAVLLAACALELERDVAVERVLALGLTAACRRAVLQAIEHAPTLAMRVDPRAPKRSIYAALVAARCETVVLAGALSAGGTEIARSWLTEGRHVALAIDGNDLVREGFAGPAIREGLRAALIAKLAGEVDSPAEQLQIARDQAARIDSRSYRYGD